jgi:hypothetical protein
MKESFIYLNRENTRWRMDACMFERFMEHVAAYFSPSAPLAEVGCEDVQYAEIEGEDLNTVSVIFGGYSPNDHQILLVPVHPEHFTLPFRNSFDLSVRMKHDDSVRSLSLKVI